jgi:hypothetical protein
LYGNLAFDDVAVEQCAEFFSEILLNAQRDVVEVNQEGGVRCMDGGLTQMSARPN